MTLEQDLFRQDYPYKSSVINTAIGVIQKSGDPNKVQNMKTFVFKAMKDIVRKNITNYINLLNGIEYQNVPERDELVTECYLIFDKCLARYNPHYDNGITASAGNFYFFFNKSLSRSFFKEFRRAQRQKPRELTPVLQNVNRQLRIDPVDDVETLIELLGFDEVEQRIARGRLAGQRTADFLKDNVDITEAQYVRTLKRIKDSLRQAYAADDIDYHYGVKELVKMHHDES